MVVLVEDCCVRVKMYHGLCGWVARVPINVIRVHVSFTANTFVYGGWARGSEGRGARERCVCVCGGVTFHLPFGFQRAPKDHSPNRCRTVPPDCSP